tara:strand:- start:3860 stop:4678 length:819 start_codon:yes stop_codon:yes gene_type:complete
MKSVKELKSAVQNMRKDILRLAFNAGKQGAHIGPSLSVVELLAVLYGRILKYRVGDPTWFERDRFLLSKGHSALAFYTALEMNGIITREDLMTFENNAGMFPGQPLKNIEKGIEISSGSLGHGLAWGVGISLGIKRKSINANVYVLLGDGECDEGSVWESAMSATNFELNNLIAIVDRNGMQSDGATKDILDIPGFDKIWEAMGWNVITTDGHKIEALIDAFSKIPNNDYPSVVIANTVKGKGISFMENNVDWHHNYLNQELLELALSELDY